jgi:hypothetical protein
MRKQQQPGYVGQAQQQHQPAYVEQAQQQQQLEQMLQQQRSIRRAEIGQQERELSEPIARKTPGHVTRVVADLLIFVEVLESDRPLGLVFKPDKIIDYHGERLEDLGIRVGTVVSEITWDTDTLKVSSVVLGHRMKSRPMSSSA